MRRRKKKREKLQRVQSKIGDRPELHRNMAMYKQFLAISVCLLLSRVTFGLEQEDREEIQTVVSRCMERFRQQIPDECDSVYTIGKKHGVDLIPYLEDYMKDPNERVRWRAYAFIVHLGLDTEEVPARERIVEKLVRRLGEEEAKGNWQYLVERLARFTSADFSEQSRRLVRDLLLRALTDRHVSRRGDIILLAGVADLKSELPRLKEFIDEHEGKLKQQHEKRLAEWRQVVEKMPERNRAYYARTLLKQYWHSGLIWPALRARARMGVKEDIARCIELVESHPDEDYRVAWLLKELSYVRQPEVVDYLHKYLKSEKVRESKGADTVVGTYAQHAAKALAQMLRGFPGRKSIGGDKETIELRRKWMAEQKEWDIIR